MKNDTNPPLLDLEQFSSPEAAIHAIERDNGFDGAVRPVLTGVAEDRTTLTMLMAFCMSSITRARGLYEGVVREIQYSNPPAVFVLMRQLAETVAVVRYVADHPTYVGAVVKRAREIGPGEQKRKSIQALVNYMDSHYTKQFGRVYDELSEMTHFGAPAVWAAHQVVSNSERTTIWRSEPGWGDQRLLYLACAQLLEVGDEMEAALVALAEAVRAEGPERSQAVGKLFDPLANRAG